VKAKKDPVTAKDAALLVVTSEGKSPPPFAIPAVYGSKLSRVPDAGASYKIPISST
jgi:hypothetical protein